MGDSSFSILWHRPTIKVSTYFDRPTLWYCYGYYMDINYLYQHYRGHGYCNSELYVNNQYPVTIRSENQLQTIQWTLNQNESNGVKFQTIWPRSKELFFRESGITSSESKQRIEIWLKFYQGKMILMGIRQSPLSDNDLSVIFY